MRSVEESESMTGNSSASPAIDFPTLCHRLKITKRKGWINHGIKGPESIADHMYTIVGDITPSNGVPKQQKSRLEQAALNEMCEVLGGGQTLKRSKSYGRSMKTMLPWRPTLSKTLTKFEFLNDAIKKQVEMILQALEYEMEHGKVLDEFFLSTAGKFQTAIGKTWAAEISSRRNSILAKNQN